MFKNEKRNDVTGWREVAVRIEVGLEISDVGTVGGGEDDLVVGFRGDDVATMLGAPVLAGDIPTTPALFKGRAIVDQGGAEFENRFTGRVRKNRAGKYPGDTANEMSPVTT